MPASGPRSGGPRALARPRLLRLLAPPWKVAVLSAPAGYGKTTLAAQLVAGRDALWCRLAVEDRDAAHLLGSLLGAASGLRRPFGARTRRLYESRRDMERDGPLLTASFLDELTPARGERLVVLDDAHLLGEGKSAQQWLRRLVEESGPRVRFLLAGRGESPLPLARFELLGGVRVLRAAELRLTPAEESSLLRKAVGRNAPARVEALAGWPAGVALVAKSLQRDAGARLPRRALAELGRAAAGEERVERALAFLAEEVFAPLPGNLKQALCRASLLETLQPDALRAVLGPRSADRLRAELIRRDLFVERSHPGAVERLHPLFRGFLRARLVESVSEYQRRRMLERLAAHRWRSGDPARAVRALAEAGALEAAVRLFDAASRDAEPARRALGPVALELTRRARAPDALSPGVLLHGALQAREGRRHDEALRLIRVAQAGFLRDRAFRAAARAFRIEGEIAVQTGRLRESRRQGDRLLTRIPARHGAARGIVALQLGHLHVCAGDPDRARAVLARGRRWLGPRGYEVERAELELAQATVEYTAGRWDVYVALARRWLPVFRRAGYHARVVATLVNMGEACTYLGEEDRALAHFDEAQAIQSGWGRSQEDPLLLVCRARAFSERGDLAEAARRFAAARPAVLRDGHPLQRFELDVWEGICARRRGRLHVAEHRLSRALAGFAGTDSPSWLALARMERALARGLRGNTEQALRELGASGRVTRRLGDFKELARNALFEARVLQVAGRSVGAPLGRALRTLERLGYLVLLRKEADVAVPLLAEALQDGTLRALAERSVAVLPESLRSAVERLASEPRLVNLPRRAAGGGALAMPLRARLLGSFRVHLGGQAVSFPRRAAASLVAYLVLRRGGPVRRETLAEALWPGAPPEASRNRFDVALNAARRALEPGVPPRGPFQVLTGEAGACRLVGLEPTDVQEFERLARACEPDLARLLRAPWSSAPGGTEAARALTGVETALSAFGGDLLADLAEASWAESERERLRERRHRLLLGRAALCLGLGRPEHALESAREVLDEDPLHEEALRLELRALAVRGDRAAVLRRYREFAGRLEDELQTAPGPETVALRRELEDG